MAIRKKILVTGGAGFLGSHLCELLIDRGHDVLCVDNFYTGTKENVAPLYDNPYFELLRHDVTFPLYVEVEEIYNLACPASPIHYQFDPVQTAKTNVHGAINMLGLAKYLRARILQASTSEVYGDPTVHPQTEDYRGNVNPIGPRSCYDEGKRCPRDDVEQAPYRAPQHGELDRGEAMLAQTLRETGARDHAYVAHHLNHDQHGHRRDRDPGGRALHGPGNRHLDPRVELGVEPR